VIPSDVASALRLQQPDIAKLSADQPQNQPVAPAQRLADALSNLVPGQRILAEIQALLPNGTYRAVVAQRDLTLALPFSAKAGDTLELEVTESDGNLTLAFVANLTKSDAKATQQESVATTLSSTGKLIGQLIGDPEGEGKRAAPAPLNGSQPLVARMPDIGAELAPVLKQALTQSGMFYEAHQARWVAGELSTEALKQEPQGKLAARIPIATVDPNFAAKTDADHIAAPAQQTSLTGSAPSLLAPMRADGQMPQEVAVLVRQQLDGLATNNFAWQGQIWPGQQLRWEIGENPEQHRTTEPASGPEWQSRLKLALPSLGDIDATLRLAPGGRISLSVTAASEGTEGRLRQNTEQLLKQFASVGLDLAQLQIQHGKTDD